MMKTALLAVATLAFLTLVARADFVIQETIEHSGKVQPVSIKVKGAKVRIDVGDTNSVITDSGTGEMTILMHSNKVRMKIDPEMVKAQLKALKELSGQQSDQPENIELKPTGNHEQINGYDTQEYTTEVAGVPTSFFIAKDYPNYQKLVEAIYQVGKNPLFAEAQSLVVPPDKLNGLPLRTVHTMKGQKLVVNIVSTQETELPDSDFEIPGDYKEIQVPGPAKKEGSGSQ